MEEEWQGRDRCITGKMVVVVVVRGPLTGACMWLPSLETRSLRADGTDREEAQLKEISRLHWEPGLVVHASHPSTPEVEAGRTL